MALVIFEFEICGLMLLSLFWVYTRKQLQVSCKIFQNYRHRLVMKNREIDHLHINSIQTPMGSIAGVKNSIHFTQL